MLKLKLFEIQFKVFSKINVCKLSLKKYSTLITYQKPHIKTNRFLQRFVFHCQFVYFVSA